MKVKHINYYGFDHVAVNKKFSGGLTYLGEVCLTKYGRFTASLYQVTNPDVSKGHKEFLLLTPMFVTGLTRSQMEEEAEHNAIHCLSCDEVIYSVHVHDFHSCSCGSVSIDGGKDYLRCSYTHPSTGRTGKYNLLTGEFKIQ